MMNSSGVRQREIIFIAKQVDIPIVAQNGISFDSCQEYYHDGFQRAKIQIMSPNAPMNGVAGRDKNNKVTHKVRVFKHDQVEVDKVVIWMDGIMTRTLQIKEVQQDPKSRRHLYLYCFETKYTTYIDDISNRSTFNRPVSMT